MRQEKNLLCKTKQLSLQNEEEKKSAKKNVHKVKRIRKTIKNWKPRVLQLNLSKILMKV